VDVRTKLGVPLKRDVTVHFKALVRYDG